MSEATRTPAPGEEYLPKIVAIAAEECGRDDASLNGATTLADLEADSLDQVGMAVAIEAAFGISIDADAQCSLTQEITLMDIAAMVARAKGEG